jgi:hypothetical protein
MIRVTLEHVPPAERHEKHAVYLVANEDGHPTVQLDGGYVQRRHPDMTPVWTQPPEWTLESFLAVELVTALREALAQDAALSEDERERRWEALRATPTPAQEPDGFAPSWTWSTRSGGNDWTTRGCGGTSAACGTPTGPACASVAASEAAPAIPQWVLALDALHPPAPLPGIRRQPGGGGAWLSTWTWRRWRGW